MVPFCVLHVDNLIAFGFLLKTYHTFIALFSLSQILMDAYCRQAVCHFLYYKLFRVTGMLFRLHIQVYHD